MRLVAASLLAGVLGACAPVSPATPDAAGRIDVLEPGPGFSLHALSPDWVTSGFETPEQAGLARVIHDGVPALRVVRPGRRVILARRVSAPLLAMPFLSWSWRMETAATWKADRPTRVLVAFAGGIGDAANPPRPGWAAPALPPFARAFLLVWAEHPWEAARTGLESGHGRFAVRGGRASERRWMRETVDLAEVYRALWPEDDLARVRVNLIGVLAEAATVPATAHIAKLRLSR
jgi:hypothetical protein